MEGIYVSIFMLTYNQEEFISQAIAGVLMQKTSFRYQLVIGEDCSTDRTREICEEYAQQYPEKIKLILNKINLGLGTNYVKTYKECTGKYIAICDGDDYWIDPLKLQKQVNFLDQNEDYKIVYTNNYSLLPSGVKIGPRKDEGRRSTSFNDLIFQNYIPSVTALFLRKDLTRNMEQWIPHFPYGDWPTYLLILADGGKIFYLNEPTAVYRKDFGTSLILRKEKSKMGRTNSAILRQLLNDSAFQQKRQVIEKSLLHHSVGLMASYNKEYKFMNSLYIAGKLVFKMNPFYVGRIYLYSLKRLKAQ